MTIKRKIVRADSRQVSLKTKDASGFIEDISAGNFLEPAFDTISDNDAFIFYKKNDWVGGVIDRVVSDCVKNRPVVVPRDKSKEIKGRLAGRIKKIDQFFWDPNGGKEGFTDIREKMIRDFLTYGRGAIEKVVDEDTRQIIELWSLSAKDIRLMADRKGNLPNDNAYKLITPKTFMDRQGVDRSIKFDIDEVIYLVKTPISRSIYGIKPLDAIAFSVASDILRAVYNGNFFVNGAEAAGILSLVGMNKREMRKFRAYWRDNFKGANKAHKTAIVNTKMDYVRMAITNRDLEFSQYGVELRNKIFAKFGMQPIIMGIVDATTGKLNSQQQIELYKEGAIKPILMKEADYYTREIIWAGFGQRDLMIEFPSIELTDIVVQSNIDAKDLMNAVRTINEVRATRGLGKVKWGDAPVVVMPGGAQIDPDTGRLFNPSSGGPPVPPEKQPKKQLENYFDSIQLKVDALLSALGNIKYVECKIEEIAKPISILYNGEDYTVKRYTLPVKFKGCQLDILLDKILNNFGENLHKVYMDCIASHIKYEVVSNIISRSTNMIPKQIDRIMKEELTIGLVGNLNNGNSG